MEAEALVQESSRHSLLVVDDEEGLVQIFAEFFGGREYDLVIARSAEEAIERIDERPFDLVVTDLNLPGADGLTVLRHSKELRPETEVIVLTGNASTVTAIDALRKGAYDYLLKPFDLYEVGQTVEKALERRRLRDENKHFVETLSAANEELRQNQEILRRHRDELSRLVEEATRRVRTLYEVGKEITSSLNLDRTLSLILEKSVGLTGASRGLLFLLDEATGKLVCGVSQGVEEDSSERDQLVEELRAANEQVLFLHELVTATLPKSGGTHPGLLIVPLLQEAQVIGTIAVLSENPTGFSRDDQELLVSLASQASIAIHNARVYGKIRDLDRMKSDFVAVVSHEVRTPLTAIKGTLEILGDEKYFQFAASQRELLDICRTNVDRLEDLINDILDFSKLESSRLSTHFAPTSVAALVEGVVVNIGNLADRKGIRILRELDADLPLVRADELRIIQVMNNLVSNAVKFSHEGSSIWIRARSFAGGVEVVIEDSGIGIASDDLPKLFSKFRQLDSSSTRKAGGTGLGLAISKGIVEEHVGRIWVESEPGHGSRFLFWLPCAVEEPEPAGQASEASGGSIS